MAGFSGAPPSCRPQCVVNSDCHTSMTCSNQKCIDPCEKSCGENTNCKTVNHSPVCTCKAGYTGEPFVRCSLIPNKSSKKLGLILLN